MKKLLSKILGTSISQHWEKVAIESKLDFPVLEFEMNGNGLVNYYESIDDVIGKWNHYLGEPIEKGDLSTFFVDNNNVLFEIIFNQQSRIKEPRRIGKLSKSKYIELKTNAEYENLNLREEILDQIQKIENELL